MDEILTTIVYAAIIFGAFLSTWVGKTRSKENYDIKQFISSLIIAGMAATASVNVEGIANQLAQLGYAGITVTYIVAGFIIDQGLAKLDKGNTKKPI